MVAGLGLIAFGGNTRAGGASDPVVEIWQCTVAMSIDDIGAFTGFTQSVCDAFAAIISGWFANSDSKISDTEELVYVKWNEYSLATGRQVTDPTVQTLLSTFGGGSLENQPVTTTYRISLDNSTRNPRARGGFYPPRTALGVQQNGRITNPQQSDLLVQAKAMLDAFNITLAGQASVGVWSRRDHAVHTANRVRVGDVPDNISRRRNHLRESYLSDSL